MEYVGSVVIEVVFALVLDVFEVQQGVGADHGEVTGSEGVLEAVDVLETSPHADHYADHQIPVEAAQ